MITIRDVARRAQVSNSTVSRVFGPPYPSVPVRVNDETRRRVEAAAAELGYRPSLFARSLKTKRSNVIGVVVRDIANPFWAGMVQGISRTCAARGYHLALINVASRSDEAGEERLLTRLGSDGILLLGDTRPEEASPEILSQIQAGTLPVVALARSPGSLPIASVRVDNAGGVDLALDLLTGLGHRRIAYIAGGSDDATERCLAFLKYCSLHDLECPPDYVHVVSRRGQLPAQILFRLGGLLVRHLMRLPRRPTALVTSNDGMAIGAISGARALGLSVPGDLSIIGFDGLPFVRHTYPPLTMIQQPVREMGQVASDYLIDVIEGKARIEPGRIIRLPARLVVRGSTGSAPIAAQSAAPIGSAVAIGCYSVEAAGLQTRVGGSSAQQVIECWRGPPDLPGA